MYQAVITARIQQSKLEGAFVDGCQSTKGYIALFAALGESQRNPRLGEVSHPADAVVFCGFFGEHATEVGAGPAPGVASRRMAQF